MCRNFTIFYFSKKQAQRSVMFQNKQKTRLKPIKIPDLKTKLVFSESTDRIMTSSLPADKRKRNTNDLSEIRDMVRKVRNLQF